MTFSAIERKAKRLKIYIGESDHWQAKPLYAVLLELLRKNGLAGATVTRGVAGFGAHSRIHTAAILDLSTDLPLIIEVIDTPEAIHSALEWISPMVREGLITIEDVEVIAYTHRFLHPLPADRRVGEIMTPNPVFIGMDQSALDAWEKMLVQNIKSLPVLDENDHVVGMLTHDDFLDRAGINARLAVAQRLDEESLRAEMNILRASHLTAKEIMSRPPYTIGPDDTIGLAAARMVKYAITRLPVVDERGKLLGIVSRLDLLRQVMHVQEQEPKQAPPPGAGRLAGETMTTTVPIVRLDADLAAVVASFLVSGEHRVIVVDHEQRPVGLISDSDVIGRIQPPLRRGILSALRGKNRPPDSTITAGEIMSPGAETITASTTIVEAIQKMILTGHKWLVVIDEQGKPSGLIDREIALQALIR